MFSLILKWCEYVFPERPSHLLVRQASPEIFLELLSPTVHPDFISLFNFKEPLIRALVHEAKFHGNPKAWTLLSMALARYLKDFPEGSILLPIPLSKKRHRERGYNQVLKVAERALTYVPQMELDARSLFRSRDTAPQTSLSRKDRLKNIENAFQVRFDKNIHDRHLIILDDVATTGATLKAAKQALSPHSPASITLLALAH